MSNGARSLEQRIDRLESIDAIRQLAGKYSLSLDMRDMDAHVNLIRLNPTTGFDGVTPGQSAAEAFRQVIQDAGFPCTIRQHRGIDVAAGCGQLKAARVQGGQHAAEIL